METLPKVKAIVMGVIVLGALFAAASAMAEGKQSPGPGHNNAVDTALKKCATSSFS